MERENWVARHGHNPSPAQLQAYQRLYNTRVAQWLDAGHGSMLLGDERSRRVVVEALTYFDGERYFLDEWVVASTHVHVLVQPRKGVRLSQVVQTWKSVSAKRILAMSEGRRLGGASTVWQGDYWDRIVRNRAHLERTRSYIRRHAAYRVPGGSP